MYKEIQNGAVAKSYITNGLLIYGEKFVISSYIRKPFLIQYSKWLCNCSTLNFLIKRKNLIFFFISGTGFVQTTISFIVRVKWSKTYQKLSLDYNLVNWTVNFVFINLFSYSPARRTTWCWQNISFLTSCWSLPIGFAQNSGPATTPPGGWRHSLVNQWDSLEISGRPVTTPPGGWRHS